MKRKARSLVVLGDSHTIALRDGLGELIARDIRSDRWARVTVQDLSYGYNFFHPFYTVTGDVIYFTDDRAKKMMDAANIAPIRRGDDRIFGFCFGFHPSGTMEPKQWEHHSLLPVADKQFVSSGLISHVVRGLNQHVFRFFEELKRFKIDFFVIPSPSLPETFFTDERRKLADPNMVKNYHRLFGSIVREELSAREIKCIDAPSTTTNDGWLLDIYASKTPVGDYHANARYGAVVMEAILPQLDVPSPNILTLRGMLRSVIFQKS